MSLPTVRHARPAAALLAALALLASCGGENALFSSHDSPAAKVDVRIKDADAVMMVRTPSAEPGARGGTTLQLDAGVFNPMGKELEHKKHVAWTSSDPDVASVDSAGFVTALDTGEVTIRVDHKKGEDSVRIAIIPVPVKSVTVDGPDSLSVDDDAQYVAAALDSAGEALPGRTVTWSSDPATVASISETGAVIALAPGTTDVVATIDGVKGTREVRVWPEQVATVTVTPADVSVPQFRKVKFTAVAQDRRGKVLTGRALVWSSSAPTIVSVDANGNARGEDVGEATVMATVEGVSGTSALTVTNPVEARALWVTRFEYTSLSAVDFPKIATIFQKAASANFNVIYFQVRAAGDAFYFDALEPCSPRMCGTFGGPRPAQDPLALALQLGAQHGIEVHAWINAYTGATSGSTFLCNQYNQAGNATNWLRANPSWSVSTKNFTTGVVTRQVDNCVGSAEYMYVSPGVPGVRTQVARVAADIARRYGPRGLKGIHLDRIRFPAFTTSYDPITQAAFRAQTGSFPTSDRQLPWADFRRRAVNDGVREVYDSLRTVDPKMVLSAAVFPGYTPRSGWSASWSFSDLYQDPQAWATGGYLDVEVPMSYPGAIPTNGTPPSWTVRPTYCANTDWTCTIDDHIARIEKGTGRQVYVGIGGLAGWTEAKKQIDLAHDRAVTGISMYSYSQLDGPVSMWSLLANGPFKHKATIPAMSWKP